MTAFEVRDLVRVDIPDQTDPDFDRYHGQTGRISEIIEDDAGMETADERDSFIYRVELDNGLQADFRWRDLRPVE